MFSLEESQLVENQTVFLPDKRRRTIFKWAVFFEVFGKLLVFVSCFPPWGSVYVDANQKNLVILGFIVLFSSLNCYYLGLYDYKKDEIPSKRHHREAFHHPVIYFAILNILSKIVSAKFAFEFWHSPQLLDPLAQRMGLSTFHGLRPWFFLVLIATDVIFVTMGLCYCIQQYEPLKTSEDYRKVAEKRADDGGLLILESRSFIILVKNDSEKEFGDLNLTISRSVTSKDNGCCGLFHTQTVSFPLSIAKICPGDTISIIPETHSMEGALKAECFRAFGNDVGEKIVTRAEEKSKEIKAQLTEEYEQRRNWTFTEEPGNQQAVCPKWSRTAQNPNYMRTLM